MRREDVRPGMRVRIMDGRGKRHAWNDKMNRWIGETVTILDRVDWDKSFVTIEEDKGTGPSRQNGHWHFHIGDLEPVEEEIEIEVFNAPSERDLLAMYGFTF